MLITFMTQSKLACLHYIEVHFIYFVGVDLFTSISVSYKATERADR